MCKRDIVGKSDSQLVAVGSKLQETWHRPGVAPVLLAEISKEATSGFCTASASLAKRKNLQGSKIMAR
jgi:hypothetical protein